MRSPALAMAWEFRRRHRWGLIALAGYALIVVIVKFRILAPGEVLNPEARPGVAGMLFAPLGIAVVYFLAVFSMGLSGDLAARQSIYPARMFTLPVTNGSLAGWPMLYGTATMAAAWLAVALFVLRPVGLHMPLIWPALVGAVFLAWTQALTWMPYGLPGLRVVVAVLWLANLDTIVLLAIHYQPPEWLLAALLAPQLPLAYFAACVAVARARRGEVPDWRPVFSGLGHLNVLPRLRRHFSSPERAQVWLEWRRNGLSLPWLTALVLPFELLLLFVFANTPELVFTILLVVLLTPPFMAGFAAATVRKTNTSSYDVYGVTPFTATRPLSSARLIAAQLIMAAWSTLATWLLVAVAVPVGLRLTGTWALVIDRIGRDFDALGTPRATAIVLLLSFALLVLTWKQLLHNLYIGLTGREWNVKSSVFLTLSFLVVIGPVADWIIEDDTVRAALWNALPWIAAVLALLKMSAIAWVVTLLRLRRLVRDRALVVIAISWLIVVVAVYTLLAFVVPDELVPRYFLALVAVLVIPLARLSAAPLALAWNRHR